MFELPDIRKFETARAYLEEFVRLNDGRSHFSHRKFASELNWPVSLLGDLTSARRAMPISRAAEFAAYFRMSGPESERLIYLCMREVEGATLNEFVEDYFKTQGNEVPIPTAPDAPPAPAPHFISSELMGDYAAMAIHTFLNWSKGQTTEEEIASMLDLVPGISSVNAVREKLAKLRADGIVSGEAPNFRVEKPNLAIKRMELTDILNSFEFLSSLTRIPWSQAAWNYGQVVFPIAKHDELIERIVQLRNWILRTAMTTEQMSAKEECIPLQIHLCVSHLLNLNKMGLELVPNSRGERQLTTSKRP